MLSVERYMATCESFACAPAGVENNGVSPSSFSKSSHHRSSAPHGPNGRPSCRGGPNMFVATDGDRALVCIVGFLTLSERVVGPLHRVAVSLLVAGKARAMGCMYTIYIRAPVFDSLSTPPLLCHGRKLMFVRRRPRLFPARQTAPGWET